MAWISADDVKQALGVTPSTMDEPYLNACVDAANSFAFRRRQEAGYHSDTEATAPGADVKLGTTLYAVALFRERGSTDSYASFEELASGFAVTGSSTQINRLLGVGKPVADLSPSQMTTPAAEVAIQTETPEHPATVLWVDTDEEP